VKETQYHVKQLRRQKMTWQQIGDLIGISRSLAWRVAHGKCDSTRARHYFGLPPKVVEVVPCRVCGEVHAKKTCPTTYKAGSRQRAAVDVPKDFDEYQTSVFRLAIRAYASVLAQQIRQP